MMKQPFTTWVISGPSGSGKSQVAAYLARRGFARIDCDKLAHQLYRRGSQPYRRLVAAFGAAVAGQRGIRRKALGRLVFAKPGGMKILDLIMLPALKREVARRLAALRRQGRRAAVVDMAVYFKAGAPKWGPVILLDASLHKRVQRLRQRGLDQRRALAQARALRFGPREKAQASLRITNTGSLSQLRDKLDTLRLKGALR